MAGFFHSHGLVGELLRLRERQTAQTVEVRLAARVRAEQFQFVEQRRVEEIQVDRRPERVFLDYRARNAFARDDAGLHEVLRLLREFRRRTCEKECPLERDLRVRRLHHDEPVDFRRPLELPWKSDSRRLHQRVLVVRFIAFFRAQKAPVAEEQTAHPALDLIVGKLLVQVHFERAVRNEDHVLLDQVLLHVRIEQIGKALEQDRCIDAAARWIGANRVMLAVRALAAAFGDDQVAQAGGFRTGGHIQRGMAADRGQRQTRRVVHGQRLGEARS